MLKVSITIDGDATNIYYCGGVPIISPIDNSLINYYNNGAKEKHLAEFIINGIAFDYIMYSSGRGLDQNNWGVLRLTISDLLERSKISKPRLYNYVVNAKGNQVFENSFYNYYEDEPIFYNIFEQVNIILQMLFFRKNCECLYDLEKSKDRIEQMFLMLAQYMCSYCNVDAYDNNVIRLFFENAALEDLNVRTYEHIIGTTIEVGDHMINIHLSKFTPECIKKTN